MRRKALILFLFGVFSQFFYGQEFNKARLDNYFDTLEVHNKFMGSIAVSQNGKIIYQRSLGFSDLENSFRANESSEYGIGAVTNTFTAVLILKAVEERKLDLDQTIDKYYPNIPNANTITIKHLLSHQSGLHNFSSLTIRKKRKMVRNIAKAGNDFVAGSKPVLNDLNYILLTYMLEKTYKKSYDELLTAYITKPIGLYQTYLGDKSNQGNTLCKSYRYIGNWKLLTETDIPTASGAGGIISTPGDLIKLCDALFGEKLLKKESLDFIVPIHEPVGCGLFQMNFFGHKGYGWNGEIDGFAAEIIHIPDSKISYALTSNGANFNTGEIAKVVLAAALNQPFEIPVFKTFKVSPGDLARYLGVYSNLDHEASLRIIEENNTLIVRGKGLPFPYALDATEEDKFTLDLLNMEFEFDPVEGLVLLKKPGEQILYTKKHMDYYFYDIGSKYLDSSKYHEAIDNLTKAIQLNSGTTEYFFLRGGAYYQLEAYDKAISDFNHCYRIIPDEPEYPYLIGMCHEKLNEFEMALLNYGNAIRLDSFDSRYYKARADLYFNIQEYFKAIEDYDQVLRIDPSNGNSYYQRGVIRYKLNDRDKACEDWNNALLNSFQEASEYFDKICSESVN